MKFLTTLIFLGLIIFPSISQAVQEEVIKKAQRNVFGIVLGEIDPTKPFLDRGIEIRAAAFHIGNGYVVTNHHAVSAELIDRRTDVKTTFVYRDIVLVASDWREHPAVLIGHDKEYDLAVYHINEHHFTDALKFSEREPRMGEEIFTIGYPLHSRQKISFGNIGNTDVWPPTADIRHMELDMAACSGNSGGPLLIAGGEIIGIVSSVVFEGGDSKCTHFILAISARYAKKVVDDLIRFGYARRASIGITMQYSKHDNKWLPAIEKVEAGSPAKKAGLKADDIILAISGRQIWTTMDVKRIILEQTIAGENITLRIMRDGEERVITVIVAEKLKNEPR